MRERETVRHVCAYDISKCNPSGGRIDTASKDYTSADWQTVAENKPVNEFGGAESDPEELPF